MHGDAFVRSLLMYFFTLSLRICVNEPTRRTWKHSHTKTVKIEPGGSCNSSSVTWKFAVGIQSWHVLHGRVNVRVTPLLC